MRRSMNTTGWALLAVALAACGNEAPATSPHECGPSNCAGCCTASGRCEQGSSAAACGLGGLGCAECGAAGACLDGRCSLRLDDAGTADSGPSGGPDAGGPDAGGPDAGGPDAGGPADGGDPGVAEDAGEPLDASGPDADQPADAGEGLDAAQDDAGFEDGGEPVDSGAVEDAGASADAGAGEDAGPPSGESCLDPFQLPVSPGSGTGSTAGTADDAQGSCGGAGGGDLVYGFHTDETLDLRAEVSAAGSGLQPVLYLRGGSCSGLEQACSVATAAGGAAFVEAGGLPAGDWFLWVDGEAGSEGPFALELLLTPPPEGDACAAPAPLAFSNGLAGGSVALFGEDTRSMHDDDAGSCGGAGGRDRVYAFTTDRALALQVRVTPDTATFRPAVYLRSSPCGAGAEAGCAVAAGAGSEALLNLSGLAAGSYFLWVDGASAAGGRFSLEATLSP